MSQVLGDDHKHERPARRDEALCEQFGGCVDDNLIAIRHREDGALRCEPLHSGRRDPDYDWEGFHRTPLNVAEMGLTTRELAIEARKCGCTWSPWEIAQRFGGTSGRAA